MSLVGKVFAVLNLLGLLGLTYLGLLVYGKAKTYTYATYIRRLADRGLPLDLEERDDQNRPLADNVGPQAQDDLFGQAGGNPVTTQVEEVKRVKDTWQKRIDGEGGDDVSGDAKKARLLAELLLPLARSGPERERMLAIRTQLADDKSVAELKKHLQLAVRPALQLALVGHNEMDIRPDMKAQLDPELKLKLTFSEAYPAAVRLLRGMPDPKDKATALLWVEPKGPFEQALLKTMSKAKPVDQAATALGAAKAVAKKSEEAFLQDARGEKGSFAKLFGASFDEAIKAVREDLQKQFDQIFDEPLKGERVKLDGSTDKIGQEERKLAAAKLLFNLVEADLWLNRSEGEEFKLPVDDPLSNTKYKRVQAVVGVRMFVRVLNEQAAILDQIASELDKAIAIERDAFASVHQVLLTAVKNASTNFEQDERTYQGIVAKVESAQDLVKRQQTRVNDYEGYVADARKQTAEKLATLREMSKELLKIRIKARDATDSIQDQAKEVERLEGLKKK
jgi:hypothetical protein